MLESWGVEVNIASDGLQAVQLLEKNYYDLVLMDIQMPNMDGLAATAKIRAMQDPYRSAIPIIALTANALKTDSDLYLAAGMNDYISKPFGEANLFQVISRNLIRNEKKPVMKSEDTQKTSMPGNENLFDLSTIRDISGGDEGFVKKMIELFIETVPTNLKELNSSLNTENWEQVSKSAHKLKSTIDSMGIVSIREDIRKVEINAKKREALADIPNQIDRVNTVICECIRLLELELIEEVH
jgi:CheY-like chemotaxis protein/HPt (histidine-containing phosphotransfer) domain-containing protein